MHECSQLTVSTSDALALAYGDHHSAKRPKRKTGPSRPNLEASAVRERSLRHRAPCVWGS